MNTLAGQNHTSPTNINLWTQKEAAAFLNVSPRYVLDSSVPKLLLPGTGSKGKQLVRYDPEAVRTWLRQHMTHRRFA
jgi:hypothetical protein